MLNNGQLHGLVPFVRQWYGVQSQFKWRDDAGHVHTIRQGDGGEQGDALMPALFCLALQPALQRIRAALPPGSEVLAYLDDIYIVCNIADATVIYDNVRSTLKHVCHVDVNVGKLAAWSKNHNECPPGLRDLAPTA